VARAVCLCPDEQARDFLRQCFLRESCKVEQSINHRNGKAGSSRRTQVPLYTSRSAAGGWSPYGNQNTAVGLGSRFKPIWLFNLGHVKFVKIFKISRHIECLNTYMKH
jgi:hypothetical protein